MMKKRQLNDRGVVISSFFRGTGMKTRNKQINLSTEVPVALSVGKEVYHVTNHRRCAI